MFVLFFHEKAFLNTPEVIENIYQKMNDLIFLSVPETRISLEEAVNSYMFNSQIVTLPNKKMHIIAPMECNEMPTVKKIFQEPF